VKLFKFELEKGTRDRPKDSLNISRKISLQRMEVKEKIPSAAAEEEKAIDSSNTRYPVNFRLMKEEEEPRSPRSPPPKSKQPQEFEIESPGGRQSGSKQKRNRSMYASSHKTQETPGRNLILEESVPLDQWTSDGDNDQSGSF